MAFKGVELKRVGERGIFVDFGDYANPPFNQCSPIGFNCIDLSNAKPTEDYVFVRITGEDSSDWRCSFEANANPAILIIDKIDNVQPLSNVHLIELLTSLM